MWTSTLDLTPRRVLLTRLLGLVWPGAYFSSFAPLRVENLPRQPLPAPDWVRVRNRLAGICGSDLHLIYADGDLRVAPAALPGARISYPGHEVVGEVIEIGANVQNLHVGDRVVLQHGPNCISANVHPPCHSCAAGNYNLCEYGTLPGPRPFGGGWSEEMLLHEQQLFPVPATLSDEQAVMLEPTAVAVHAVLRSLPQPGDRVLIIGAGTIGLLTLAVIRAFVPEAEVSVLARHPFQIEQATRLGAARILYPQDNYNGIQRATQAQLYRGPFGNKMLLGGFDGIYDTIGTSKTVHSALRWARANSTVVIVGVSLHMMRLDLTPIWYQEVNLLGSMSHGTEHWPPGSHEHRSSFDLAAELIEHNQVSSENLITHRFALTNYQNALLTAVGKTQSRSIKVVFDYSLLPATIVPNVRTSSRLRRPSASTSPLSSPLPQTPEALPQTSNTVDIPIMPQISPADDTKVVSRKDLMDDTAKTPAFKKQARVTPRLPLSQEQAPSQTEQELLPARETASIGIPTILVAPTIPTITTASAVSVAEPPELTPAISSEVTGEPADTVSSSVETIEAHAQPATATVEEAISQNAEVTEPESNAGSFSLEEEPATPSEIAMAIPSEHSAEETSQPIAEIPTSSETTSETTASPIIDQPIDASINGKTDLASSDAANDVDQLDTTASDLPPDSAIIVENGEDAATKDGSESFPFREGVSTAYKAARPRRRKKNLPGR